MVLLVHGYIENVTGGGGGATPSRTGTPSQVDGSAGNGSTSVTVPADCNLVVAFWAFFNGNAGESMSSLTVNGVGFTIRSQLADGAATDENAVGVATLVSPATGSQTFAWNYSANTAKSEGGEIVLVYYKDANTGDPVRASGTNAETIGNDPTVGLASTVATDRVVGFTQSFGGSPDLTGVTEFIDNTVVNNHHYDVGDDTGLTGTVNVGNSAGSYSAAAAISLKTS